MNRSAVSVLEGLVVLHRGDAAAALRAFSGLGVTELAERVALPRTTVANCLHGTEGRTYGHVRRALEAELGLDPFDLDAVLPPIEEGKG